MTNSISRLAVFPVVNPVSQEGDFAGPKGTGGASEATGSFQKFIIEKPLANRFSAPVISPAQHQAARRRLFDKLVRQVLNDKNHPFSGLDTEVKQDMINSITEELVQSHYKV